MPANSDPLGKCWHTLDNKTVLVLGAGFTRAIAPTAPLLVGDWDIPVLIHELAALPHAYKVLTNALSSGPENVNLEQLLTRLVGMPYDSPTARHEYDVVMSRLLQAIDSKIRKAKEQIVSETLSAFTELLFTSGASIVTFNYDDVVDESLYTSYANAPEPHGWHPDGGYGFFCRPARNTVLDGSIYMNDCQTLILKLHGSLNWRSLLGSPTARSPGQIVHYESWFTEPPQSTMLSSAVVARIGDYLDPDPLIVPPLLTKSELTLHPVLRLVWSRAREKLEQATRVVFIGYSFPTTDLAARILFQDTLTHRGDISVEVVDLGEGQKASELRARYLDVLSPVRFEFHFDGALAWIERNRRATR